MGTIRELCQCVRAAGLPFAQVSWDTTDSSSPPDLPYALVVPTDSYDIVADGTNYARRTSYDVELYTRGRDFQTESKLESRLSSAGFTYERRHVPLGSGVLETVYTVITCGV